MSKTLELSKLTRIPFTTVPEEKVTVWAGYEELRQELMDIVESCRSDRVGLSEFVILHGEIGTGKSHALRYLLNCISEEQRDEYQSAVVYLSTLRLDPKMNFLVIYRKIIDELRPHIKKTADELDTIVEADATGGGMSESLQEQMRQKEEYYHEQPIAPNFPSLALILKAIHEDEQDAWSVLEGQVEKAALRKFNLVRPIDTEYDAVRCLSAYINLCTRGYTCPTDTFRNAKAFYFLIDEVEYMLDFKPAEVLSINQGLRDLVNASPENTCFLLGMTGDVRDIYAVFDKYVMGRMSRDPIEIQPLDVEQSLAFLTEVLKNFRSDPKDPDEYPFREAALQRIVEETPEKTARGLFRSCRRVLENAVLENRLKPGGWIEKKDVEDLM